MWHRIVGCTLLVLALAATGDLPGLRLPRAAAEELQPTDNDRLATRSVLEIIQQRHILKREFDRRMAGQALDSYLAALDPQKLYFLQSDVAEFNRRKVELADELKEGDVAIAFDVYRRYQQRVREAEAVWQEWLKPDAGHDFTAREVVVIDPKARAYARDAKVFREQWRLWIKYTLLTMKTDPEAKDFDLARACDDLSASYARFARGVRLAKGHEVLESFLQSVGGRYDSGTSYTSPATLEEYQESQRGHFVGLGVQLQADGRIDTIFPGGAAAADGRLKPNDRIVSVGQGASGAMTDVTRLTLKEMVALVRGAEGTEVRLGIRRPGEDRTRIFTLRRAKVFAPESKVEARVLQVGATKVGYLDVPNFYKDDKTGDSTAVEVRKQLEQFTARSVDVVVLDLRRCGGGYLDQALALAGLFIGKGPIIQVKNQAGEVSTQENDNTEMAWQKPLVVLTGRHTASGAEIVCAAVQDYKRGLVVGDDSTYGLGLIRTPVDLPDQMGFVMVTTGQFYRVSGEGFQQRGVKPDVLVPSAAAIRPRAEPDTASNFGFDRLKATAFQTQDMVSTEAVLGLRASSRARRRAAAAFKTLQTLTEWEQGQSSRAIETLNEAEYRAKLKEAPADTLPKSKPGAYDYYLKEVCAIAAEYGKAVGDRTATPANIVKAPPPEDPEVARRRDLDNQREAARQSIQQWEEEVRILNNKIAAAELALVIAKKVYDDAEAGSAQEVLAELGYIAAKRVLAELQGNLSRAEAELQAARSRYNRLRD
jgi:carboxyl-terminal processing protease